MDARFMQDGFEKCLAHAIEECGEFLAAAGKTQRWGLESYNPDLPPEQRETNEAWLRREMHDVFVAIRRLDRALNGEENDPARQYYGTGLSTGQGPEAA